MKEYLQHPLKNLHTFALDVSCKRYLELEHYTEISSVFNEFEREREKYLILGGGSNILFSTDYSGTILKNSLRGIEVIRENEKEIIVKAASGENWDSFVETAVNNGWYGIENLSLIPGTVGAAPIQNIGAYGQEVGDVIESVEVYLIDEQTEITLKAKQCEFGYRESIFKHDLRDKAFITAVNFKLQKRYKPNLRYKDVAAVFNKRNFDDVSAQEVREAVISIRRKKLPDPQVIGNAGSFFKNPVVSAIQYKDLKRHHPDLMGYETGDEVKLAAAWLIDKLGWKGKRKGGAGVHDKQALVLVNHGNAKPQEVLELKNEIQKSVDEYFGVELQEEVNVV